MIRCNTKMYCRRNLEHHEVPYGEALKSEFEMEEQRMKTFQGGALSALDVEEGELALEVLVGVLRVRDPRGVPPLGAVRVVHHLAQAEHLLAEPAWSGAGSHLVVS